MKFVYIFGEVCGTGSNCSKYALIIAWVGCEIVVCSSNVHVYLRRTNALLSKDVAPNPRHLLTVHPHTLLCITGFLKVVPRNLRLY
jgi:hypothetical protein